MKKIRKYEVWINSDTAQAKQMIPGNKLPSPAPACAS